MKQKCQWQVLIINYIGSIWLIFKWYDYLMLVKQSFCELVFAHQTSVLAAFMWTKATFLSRKHKNWIYKIQPWDRLFDINEMVLSELSLRVLYVIHVDFTVWISLIQFRSLVLGLLHKGWFGTNSSYIKVGTLILDGP